MARYYAKIFESDWRTAAKTLPGLEGPEAITPEALSRGNFVEVNYGDYVQF
jgi:hypothetical protein